MLDIQMVWDVVATATDRPRGARRRAAEKHNTVPATITEAIRRVEEAFDVSLFENEASKASGSLTAHGRAFAEYGNKLLQNFQIFRKFVQEAD